MKQGQVRFSIKTRMILLVGLVIAPIVVTTSIFSYYNAQDMMGSAIARRPRPSREERLDYLGLVSSN